MAKLNLLFLTLISVYLDAQLLDIDFTWLNQIDYKSVKEIKIYKQSKLGIIQQFDKYGNPIFVKNNEFNGDNVFAVWDYSYQNDKLERIIFGHSNVGFSESDFVYSKNKTEAYIYEEIEDNFDANSFPYRKEVQGINSKDEVFRSKTLIKLKKRKRFLIQIDDYNDSGKVLRSITKNAKGKKETETLYSYSKTTEKVEYKTDDTNSDNEVIKTFNQNGKLLNEKYRNTEVSYFYTDNSLIKKITFESGKLTESETYEYNAENKLSKKITFVSDYGKTFTDKYEYNEKGFIKNVEIEKLEGISKYDYEYVYW